MGEFVTHQYTNITEIQQNKRFPTHQCTKIAKNLVDIYANLQLMNVLNLLKPLPMPVAHPVLTFVQSTPPPPPKKKKKKK